MHPLEALCRCALQAPSADNSQPFRYQWSPGKVTCHYDAPRVEKSTFVANDSANLIAAGAAYANVLMAAQNLSIPIRSNVELENLDDHQQAQYFSFVLDSDSRGSIQESDIRNLPLFRRQTNRLSYQKKAISPGILTQIINQNEGSAHLDVVHQTDNIEALGKLLERASVIRFHTQEAHEWLSQSIRYGKDPDKKREGLDIHTLGLPPGGGLFMRATSSWDWMQLLNRCGIGKLMAKIDSKPIYKASALLTFIGEETPRGAFDTGQLITRVWTQLNQDGLSVQPYYVLSDLRERQISGRIPDDFKQESEAILTEVNSHLKLKDNERLYMVFRLGYSTKSPVPSLRLPLDQVLYKKF